MLDAIIDHRIADPADSLTQAVTMNRSGKGRASFMLRKMVTVDDFLGRKLNDSEVLEEVMGMMLAPTPLF